MTRRWRIGVLMGGWSREREISLRSGQQVTRALRRRGHAVVPIDVDRNLPLVLQRERIEVAFLALHGPGGEDGIVQGLLEILGIPYTGSGVLASALAMNKIQTRRLLQGAGVPVPPGRAFSREQRGKIWEILETGGMDPPWVVKPARQGSTIGVSRVDRWEDLDPALDRAFHLDREILVEAWIPGVEITVGILDGEPLPLVEILPLGGIYDTETKTTPGRAEYRVPAPLSEDQTRQIQALGVQAFRLLGCCGPCRVDFRLDEEGNPYILEVNTLPGLTAISLLPLAARAVGMDYETLVERILHSAFQEKERFAEGVE